MLYVESLLSESLLEAPFYIGTWTLAFSFTYVAGTTVSVTPTLVATVPLECSVEISAGEALDDLTVLQNGAKGAVEFTSTVSGVTNLYVRLTLRSSFLGSTPVVDSIGLLVEQQTSLYTIATQILADGLAASSGSWEIDPELQKYLVPYLWLSPTEHRKALGQIAEAAGGVAFQDRLGSIRVQAGNYLTRDVELPVVDSIGEDRILNIASPVSKIKNRIQITTFPYAAQAEQALWTLTDDLLIDSGETRLFRVKWADYEAAIDCAISLVSTPAGATVTSSSFYSWGADFSILGSSAGQSLALSVRGKPLALSGQQIVERSDGFSIRKNGEKVLVIKENAMVQTEFIAGEIAQDILDVTAQESRDIELTWRGDPTLELGDKVSVVDVPGVIVTQEFNFNGALSASAQIRKI